VTGRHDVSVFTARRGEAFVLRLPDGATQDLELIEVHDLGRRETPGGELSNYGLTFLARGTAPLPQAIYHLEHPMLGPMDVFLVPIGRGAEGIRYEAIFN
jgi:uncharacterized protein DUF6916